MHWSCFMLLAVGFARSMATERLDARSNATSVSLNSLCGGVAGYTCVGSSFGDCCSQYGYCGSTDAYCAFGCNTAFGNCKNISNSGPTSTSTSITSRVAAATCVAVATNKTGHGLSALLPSKGCTLKEEIQCYSLPYGGIGFASHIITYYTIFMLSIVRSPWTWKRLRHGTMDMWLAIIGIMLTVGLSLFTIIRCHNRWQFSLIATWKMTLSLSLGAIATTIARMVRKSGDYKNIEWDEDVDWLKIGGSLLIYAIGVVIGVVGLFSLVKETWDITDVRKITYAFGGVVALVCVCFAFVGCAFAIADEDYSPLEYSALGTFGALIGMVGIAAFSLVLLGALYSDWILGAVAENLAGVPSSDNMVLFWLYFGAKRLPFLSL